MLLNKKLGSYNEIKLFKKKVLKIRIIRRQKSSQLLRFWPLYIVRIPRYKRTRRFGNCICFRPQSKREAIPLLGTLERATINHRYNILEKL
jgi:hypothetical protein